MRLSLHLVFHELIELVVRLDILFANTLWVDKVRLDQTLVVDLFPMRVVVIKIQVYRVLVARKLADLLLMLNRSNTCAPLLFRS